MCWGVMSSVSIVIRGCRARVGCVVCRVSRPSIFSRKESGIVLFVFQPTTSLLYRGIWNPRFYKLGEHLITTVSLLSSSLNHHSHHSHHSPRPSTRRRLHTSSSKHCSLTMSSKLDYLSKYTSGDKKKKKKKKSKHRDAVLVDENDWDAPMPEDEDDEDEEGPVVVNSPSIVKREFQSDHEPTRKRYDSDDEEPTTRRRHDSDDEEEESSRRRHDSDEEEPPRRRRYDSDDNDSQPETKRRRYDSDESLPEKRRHDSDDNVAAPDKQPSNMDARRRPRHDSDDESRPRRHDSVDDSDRPRKPRYDSDDQEDREKMSSGHTAGLQQAHDFRKAETKLQKRRRQEAQAMVDRHGMGDTVYRDTHGKQVDAEEITTKQPKQLSQEAQAALNKGRVQKLQEEAQAREWKQVQTSSFARHENDTGLEEMRRDVIREGDPMAVQAAKVRDDVVAVC